MPEKEKEQEHCVRNVCGWIIMAHTYAEKNYKKNEGKVRSKLFESGTVH